jgi:NADH-quinone oxidoreductase subunit D
MTVTEAAEIQSAENVEAGTTRKMTLNMGPQHPSTHGVLRVVLELDGETVTKAQPEIGFLHTGIEKQCEALTWQQVIPLTDRVDYLANLSNNLCYCLAVEKLLGIEPPPRAVWTRVLLTEITRINSHLVWLGTHALDMGAMSMFFYCTKDREDVLKIYEMFSGQRLMTSYFRIGGLALDHPRGGLQAIRKFIQTFPEKIDQYETLLDENPIWKQRTIGVGVVPVDTLLAMGATGPMIRAAGIPWDARKDEPYSGYQNFEFDVPTRTENDVYARYRVRMEEMRQSIRIMAQALEGMPEGPFQADAPKVVLPQREKMKTQMEALIYQVIESPRGELGYYIVSDGNSKPWRVHMRTPSFGNIQALGVMCEGGLIADTIASMGSMDFVLGDTDR